MLHHSAVMMYYANTEVQKLQREISNHRGISYERSISSPALEGVGEPSKTGDSPSTPTDVPDGGTHGGSETKRKYRRHPKADENAPVRAPSAYVVFSNKIREDVRSQNMSFTEIAKLVGDKWQKLSPAEKEPYEAQATAAKERYNAELAEYRKTDAYRDYLRYLADFKAKHAGSTTDSKRPKLEMERESSGGSLSTKSVEASELPMIPPTRVRVGSISTVGSVVSQGDLPSPIPFGSYLGQGMPPLSARLPPMSPSNDTSNASLLSAGSRSYLTFSSQSSVSDESTTLREYSDPIPHAAQLSLLPGPARSNEPPLQAPISLEHAHMSSSNRRPVQSRTPLDSHQASSGSRSSGSIRSNMNSSESSFQFPNPSNEDLWRSPNHPPIPLGPVALPPLLPPDRLPDVMQDHSQRILPMPTPTSSAPTESYHPRSLSRISTMHSPRQQELPGLGLSLRLSQEQKSPLDRNESEAADALAGLAYGSRHRDSGSRNDERRAP